MLLSLADDDEEEQKPSSLIARFAYVSSGTGAGDDADPFPAPLVWVVRGNQDVHDCLVAATGFLT